MKGTEMIPQWKEGTHMEYIWNDEEMCSHASIWTFSFWVIISEPTKKWILQIYCILYSSIFPDIFLSANVCRIFFIFHFSWTNFYFTGWQVANGPMVDWCRDNIRNYIFSNALYTQIFLYLPPRPRTWGRDLAVKNKFAVAAGTGLPMLLFIDLLALRWI